MKLVEVNATKDFASTFLNDIFFKMAVNRVLDAAPGIDAIPTDVVAEMLYDFTGEGCPCNFSPVDEWLSEVCELQDECPNPKSELDCWKQFVKHWIERKDNE